jgi:hypothetical protein
MSEVAAQKKADEICKWYCDDTEAGLAELNVVMTKAFIELAGEWNPPATAPQDGTPVLVDCEHTGGRQMAVCWSNGKFWSGGPAQVPGFVVMAWRVLPQQSK